jgi:cytochrome c oxidase assembly protein subunit 15
LWGRLIGIVFIVPFVFFLIKKYFTKNMTISLVILFVLGMLQAALGWIMVQSGLNPDDIYVSHIRLAVHFIAAFLLLAYEVWFVLKIKGDQLQLSYSPKYTRLLAVFVLLLVVQFVYGAFMAGLKAAPVAPTWPDINGVFVPETIASDSWFSNALNVHFIHRTMAYTIVVCAIFIFLGLKKWSKRTDNTSLKTTLKYPLVFIGMQVTLGILAVLNADKIRLGNFGTYETIAILHQLIAIGILISVIPQLYLVSHEQKRN